jgi:hypothetical protein
VLGARCVPTSTHLPPFALPQRLLHHRTVSLQVMLCWIGSNANGAGETHAHYQQVHEVSSKLWGCGCFPGYEYSAS